MAVDLGLEFLKLGARLQGLQAAVQALVAMQLVSQVEDPLRASRDAELSTAIRDRLIEGLRVEYAKAPASAAQPEMAAMLLAEASSVIASSFDGAAGLLDMIAKASLDLAASDAGTKN